MFGWVHACCHLTDTFVFRSPIHYSSKVMGSTVCIFWKRWSSVQVLRPQLLADHDFKGLLLPMTRECTDCVTSTDTVVGTEKFFYVRNKGTVDVMFRNKPCFVLILDLMSCQAIHSWAAVRGLWWIKRISISVSGLYITILWIPVEAAYTTWSTRSVSPSSWLEFSRRMSWIHLLYFLTPVQWYFSNRRQHRVAG